jgi:hypothetical protein
LPGTFVVIPAAAAVSTARFAMVFLLAGSEGLGER